MQRTLLPAMLLFALLVLGLATRTGAILALALPFVVYLGAALLGRPTVPRLSAMREVSTERAATGEPVSVRLLVTNDDTHRVDVRIADLLPGRGMEVEGDTSVRTTLAPGASVELRYTVRGGRGLHRFGGVEVVTTDPFGLLGERVVLPAPGQLFILPDVLRLRRVDIRPRRTKVYAGFIPVQQGGPGIEFYGLREYQPGDPQRHINARATARRLETLFVNEFEQERVADIGLILDGRRRANVLTPAGSLFEHSVGATAALADAFLRSGNRVGLAIYTDAVSWTYPGYGNVQRERILRALAGAQPGDRPAFEGLDLLPARLFPGRSQLVIVSSLVAEDLEVLTRLRAQGYQVMLISPDPVAYEQELLPAGPATDLAARIARLERDLLLRRLRGAGIEVVDWPVTTSLAEVLHTAFGSPRARPPLVPTGLADTL